jgi:TonB family protein
MSSSEVRAGSILYRPSSDDTIFRFEVRDAQDRAVVETTRVLDGLKALSTPAPKGDAVQRPPVLRNVAVAQPVPAQTSPAPQVLRPRSFVAPPLKSKVEPEKPREVILSPPDERIAVVPAMSARLPLMPQVSEAPPKPERRGPNNDLQVPVRSVLGSRTDLPSVPLEPPKVLRQVTPDLHIAGGSLIRDSVEVEVQVDIDSSGRVLAARILRGADISGAYIARQALNAARQWTFVPAKVRGRSVPSQHVIVFRFRSGAN